MIKQLVLRSRSIREFKKGERISKDDLIDLVNTARFCPSAMNLQPLKYKVVSDPDQCARLTKMTKWAAKIKDTKLPPKGKEPSGFILICSDDGIAVNLDYTRVDAGISAQTIMLAACEKRIGACILASFKDEEIRKELDIPDGITPLLLIGLGAPDQRILLCETGADGSTSYYRKEDGTHVVPKRHLEDILL